MSKTPAQIIYEATPQYVPWERADAVVKGECEAKAAAVVAHVRPQIEAEARLAAVDRYGGGKRGWRFRRRAYSTHRSSRYFGE